MDKDHSTMVWCAISTPHGYPFRLHGEPTLFPWLAPRAKGFLKAVLRDLEPSLSRARKVGGGCTTVAKGGDRHFPSLKFMTRWVVENPEITESWAKRMVAAHEKHGINLSVPNQYLMQLKDWGE